MRILLYAINGKGMGHLTRTSVLARAARAADPRVTFQFAVGSPLYPLVMGAGFEVTKVPDLHHPRGFFCGLAQRHQCLFELFEALIDVTAPDVFLADFAVHAPLFGLLARRKVELALVLRKQRPLDMLKLAARPCVRHVQRFLLPHSCEELPRRSLPWALRSRARYLGPVVRTLELERVGEVRARYAAPHEKLVVVTIGGGGYEEAYALLVEAERVARSCAGRGWRWVMLYGPYYRGDVPVSEPSIERLRFEADLPELLAAADCVVCNTGYNTLRELQASGAPAVVVPRRDAGRDDQVARARAYCEQGRALLAAENAEQIERAVRQILDEQAVVRQAPSAEHSARALGARFLDALR